MAESFNGKLLFLYLFGCALIVGLYLFLNKDVGFIFMFVYGLIGALNACLK